ncbi:arabinose efflux permease [Anaerolinea thermolimosa]|nr:arabinose efflux permease [Anaerolinea thermolimosa]
MASKGMRSGRTLFALGLGYLIDQGEAQAMGVLSPIIQRIWGISFGMIGLMETLRSIAQTVSAPFWGYVADKYSRKKVLIFGTGIWGLWTIAVGLIPNFSSMMIIRAISGLGLGCLMPATFSLLGDHYPQEKRGRALGVIGLVGLMGTVLGVLALGFVASPDLWRWGFIGLGLASVLSGIVIWVLVEEPPRGSAEPELAGLITHETEKRYEINPRDMLYTLKIPTIWAAILQGITGSMPWVVMEIYFINWMVRELGYTNDISFSDPRGSAPLIFAAVVVSAALSNLMGGFIGDYAEKINKKYGRTVIGQFSVLIGVPLMYFFLTRAKTMTFGQLFAFASITALLIGWPGRGAKEPMMQAVVPPEMRSSAYSVVNLIEGGLSAFAGLIAGSLADRLGLTTAMLWTIPFPWIICGILFSLFYFTYPRDAEKVRRQMASRREELLTLAQEEISSLP